MSVYASNKALFELCLDRALTDMQKGHLIQAGERRSALLDAFNSALDDLERINMLAVERQLMQPPKPATICSICTAKIKAFRLLT